MIISRREMPDGRIAKVYLQLFGTARLIIGDGKMFVDDGW